MKGLAQSAIRGKGIVREFWEQKACGEVYAKGDSRLEQFESQSTRRYANEPFIRDFAKFHEGAGKRVLEIGVGMGADHLQWAISRPDALVGIDLTDRAVELTRERLQLYGLKPDVQVGDAERLPFPSASFDIIYSWGVLHHSPDTARAIAEVWRVLRPGGTARIMIYHHPSIVGLMLWLRYGLLRGVKCRDIYSRYLESPGTKAYDVSSAMTLFRRFDQVTCRVELSVGDLLEAAAGQGHSGVILDIARKVWPRRLIGAMFQRYGLFLLIEAKKV